MISDRSAHRLVLPVALAIACAALASGTQQAVVLENDLVRVTVVPGSGAHIAGFTLKATGSDFMGTVDGPFDGFTDVLDVEWPGPQTQAVPFAAKRSVGGDVTALTCSLDFGGIRLERTMTLRAGSTRLGIEVKLTNTNDRPRTLKYGAHVCAKAGEYFENARDFMYSWDDRENGFLRETTKVPYPMAREYGRAPRWLALGDDHTGEMILFEYGLGDVQHFMVWRGGSTQNPQMYWRFEDVSPGQSRTVRMAMSLFEGVTGLDAASAEAIAQVCTDREVYDQDERIRVSLTVCASQALPGVRVRWRLGRESGKALVSRQEDATDIDPLTSLRLRQAFSTAKLADGAYTLECLLERPSGEVLLHCRKAVRIDGRLVNPIRTAIARWHTRLARVDPDASRASFREKVRHHWTKWLLEDVDGWYKTGDYEAARKGLRQIESVLSEPGR